MADRSTAGIWGSVREGGVGPTAEAGVANHVWSVGEIVGLLE